MGPLLKCFALLWTAVALASPFPNEKYQDAPTTQNGPDPLALLALLGGVTSIFGITRSRSNPAGRANSNPSVMGSTRPGGQPQYTDAQLDRYDRVRLDQQLELGLDENLDRDIDSCAHVLIQQERSPQDANLRELYADYYRRCQHLLAAALERRRNERNGAVKAGSNELQPSSDGSHVKFSAQRELGERVLQGMRQAFVGKVSAREPLFSNRGRRVIPRI